MSAVKACLTKARDVLMDKGWCQYAFRELDGRVCAIGAIREAGEVDGARDVLRAVVGDQIATWNDAFGRRFEEVLRAFNKAIEVAK